MTARDWWTIPQLAKWMHKREAYFVGEIKAGRLQAVNLGSGTRPRYHVSQEAVDEFLRARAVTPAARPAPVRRRLTVPKYV